MGMKLRCLAGVLGLVVLGLLAGCLKSTSTTTNTGSGVLYVATQGDSLLSAFTIDLSDGLLTSDGKVGTTGTNPTAMILTPDGKTIFMLNSSDASVTAFTVNSDGSTTAAGSAVATGVSPRGLAMDSGGKFLFVANSASNTVSVFSVSGTTLTPVPQSLSLVFGNQPSGVAVTPDGKYLYVPNQTDGTVSGFAVDASGVLSPLPNSPFTVGTTPSTALVTADGNFLYVANQGSNNISAFTVCDNATPSCVTPDGSLTPVSNSPFSAGLGPVAILEDPSNTFLFVADEQSNQVSQYKISTGTGALTPLSPGAASTGVSPVSLAAITGPTVSSTSVTTDYLYVTNLGGSSISVYSYDTTTGALTVDGSLVPTGGQPAALVLK
jgi:6-phosphogluconolactonase (cycloisomerase 2 family)